MRLLEVDNRVVLPVGKFVRVQITAGDVEHSWFHLVARRQSHGGAGTPERIMAEGRSAGDLLWPMLDDLRQRPRLYAHRHRRRRAGSIRGMGEIENDEDGANCSLDLCCRLQ